jgi:capsular polysaccharide biosynthesis protein
VEIADYLKVARRSLWILLVVPLGAGLLAGVFVATAPPKYQATATVDLALGDGKSPYAGSHGQVLYVDDFRNAATFSQVVDAVSAKTGVPANVLNSELQVKQVGDGSVMSISFPAASKAKASDVVVGTASATLDRILQTQYNATKPTLQAAIDARRPMLQRQAALTQSAGGITPDKAIRTVQLRINSLLRQRSNLQARGNQPGALATVTQQLQAARNNLATYRPMALEYETLKTQLTSANQVVTKQSQVVQAISALQKASQLPTTVTLTPAKRQPILPTLISATLAAAGAGAFLALGIISAMELLARRRRPIAEAGVPAGAEAEAAAGAEAEAGAGEATTRHLAVRVMSVDGQPSQAAKTSGAVLEESSRPPSRPPSRRPWRRTPPAGAQPATADGSEAVSAAADLRTGSGSPEAIRLPLKPK